MWANWAKRIDTTSTCRAQKSNPVYKHNLDALPQSQLYRGLGISRCYRHSVNIIRGSDGRDKPHWSIGSAVDKRKGSFRGSVAITTAAMTTDNSYQMDTTVVNIEWMWYSHWWTLRLSALDSSAVCSVWSITAYHCTYSSSAWCLAVRRYKIVTASGINSVMQSNSE